MLSMCVFTGGDGPTWWRAWKHNTYVATQRKAWYYSERTTTTKHCVRHLDEELGALDVDDERDRVVDGHASRPVALGDKGGEPATAAVPHGQIDDQIEVVLLQVVHDAALLLFVGILVVVLLKRPVHRFHLARETRRISVISAPYFTVSFRELIVNIRLFIEERMAPASY